jgi:hypothetical protein
MTLCDEQSAILHRLAPASSPNLTTSATNMCDPVVKSWLKSTLYVLSHPIAWAETFVEAVAKQALIVSSKFRPAGLYS